MGMILTHFMTEIFSTVLQRIFCESILEPKDRSRRRDLLAWGGCFAVFNSLTYANAAYLGIAWLNAPVFIILFFCTIRYRYKDSVRTLILVTVFIYLSGMCAELLIYYGKELLPRKQEGGADILWVTGSKIIWFLLIKISLQIVKIRRKTEPCAQDWLEVFIVPAGSIWILLALLLGGAPKDSWFGFLSAASIILINIYTYYLYDKAKENRKKHMAAEILKQQYAYFIWQDWENKEWYDQMKCFRHDMKQRYIIEKALLEKRDYAALEKYCDENLEFLSSKRNVSDTGNIYVDSILNYKAHIAERENIDFSAQIHIPGDAELHAAEDFCICMGNLLDNALEAAAGMQDKRSIYVQLSADHRNIMMQVKNRYAGERKKEGAGYLTSKRDRKEHGMGLLIVQQIVKKYDGEMVIEDKDGIFDVAIVLYDFLENDIESHCDR